MKKIMVFGVFDLLHPGHIYFLRQAKRLGDFLVVSVARDVNVKKVKKRKSLQNEDQRLNALSRLPFVDKAVLGGLNSPMPHIRKEKPDIIALGYDQKSYVGLSELKKIAKVVRLKGFKPGVFKSSRSRIISGFVEKHLGRGKRLGFPTANIESDPTVPEGIYLGLTNLHSRQNARKLPALVFVGASITFGESKKKTEVYILDFRADLYGEKIEVELIKKIRENKKFDSKKKLVEQMKKDERIARDYFKVYNNSN